MSDPPAPLGTAGWFDTHCHVQDEPEVEVVLGAASAAGVGALVCVGTDVESSRRALELASSRRVTPGSAKLSIWATVGLHPHEAARTGGAGVDGVAALVDATLAGTAPVALTPVRSAPVGLAPVGSAPVEAAPAGSALRAGVLVAVGECGLDYHYDHSPRDAQRRAFAAQVALARTRSLTLVIHTREAWDDTFAVLADEGLPDRTVFHCFTGGPVEARRCLDLGAWLSFSGIVSFKGADEVRAAAALCPGERLLVETDAPFLAPVPHRGQRNAPANVSDVGAAVAAARGVAVSEVASESWLAAEAAFGIGAGAPCRLPLSPDGCS